LPVAEGSTFATAIEAHDISNLREVVLCSEHFTILKTVLPAVATEFALF
jgi:hypothetical protein